MTKAREVLMERVRRVLADIIFNDSLVITEDTTMADIPEWDSMLHVTLLMALEREFNIRLNAKEAGEAIAIRPILALVEAKTNATHLSRGD